MSTLPLTGISSMATRAVLAALASDFERATGVAVHIESVGGVDAARRIQNDEPFDFVVLASDAIDKLVASGHVRSDTKRPIVDSNVAIAVREGTPLPAIDSEDALRTTVLNAGRIGYSTGPSGTALLKIFDRWGIRESISDRLVQAPAGTPVGNLLARGDVDIAFQQLSELMHVAGVRVVGGMPSTCTIVTTFTGAVVATSTRANAVQALLDFMTGPGTATCKTQNGMNAPALHGGAR
ncbi:substrate-binding domain-containing protein [Uliginosibacterium sp. sgz301328]|uniref:substrate-binding domain-containing protein n=1 Tax=Uliginosibacterium sp. sgz301328 TaxID=3243764 RepID=UPI00359D2358